MVENQNKTIPLITSLHPGNAVGFFLSLSLFALSKWIVTIRRKDLIASLRQGTPSLKKKYSSGPFHEWNLLFIYSSNYTALMKESFDVLESRIIS